MSLTPAAKKVVADLNKKFKQEKVVLASEIKVQRFPRYTTGSLTLDYVLGGGFPGNSWNELIGENSHGKTAIAFQTIAANQAANPDFTAAWISAESWVPEYAEMNGVDLERVVVVETNWMEEAFDAVIACAASKEFDAIVLDSLAALSPSKEIDNDSGELAVGKGALLTNQFFRKVGPATARSLTDQERPVLGLVINQYREKIGVMHGDPRTTPGGKGKDFAYFTRVEVKRDEWIEVGPASSKTRIGQTIRARTIKNKSAPPQRSAYFDYYFAEGGICPPGTIDRGKEIVAMALALDLVEKSGAWIKFGDQKWQGGPAFLEATREDLDLADTLAGLVMDSLTRSLGVPSESAS